METHPLNAYSKDPWNLNNIPILPESLLRYIKSDISGMTVPWTYVGMVFSTFCWHNEVCWRLWRIIYRSNADKICSRIITHTVSTTVSSREKIQPLVCLTEFCVVHWGETKTWYSIPGASAEKFEAAIKREAPDLFEAQPDLLFQLVTLMNPQRLKEAGVDVYACNQRAGEFVVGHVAGWQGLVFRKGSQQLFPLVAQVLDVPLQIRRSRGS